MYAKHTIHLDLSMHSSSTSAPMIHESIRRDVNAGDPARRRVCGPHMRDSVKLPRFTGDQTGCGIP